MLVYRVFPHLPEAGPGEPGHPLYIHPDQGFGRWDNADLYRALYVAASPTGAVGETFAHLSRWTSAMLQFPAIDGSVRALATYSLDEETHPLLDLDDARVLLDRSLRPTDIVIRNRPRTQAIARLAYDEGRWSGVSWWSMHRPQWTLHMLWDLDGVTVETVESIPGHAAVRDAGGLLVRPIADELL